MTKYKSVTAFAPASVANVGCGFDIMGFAVAGHWRYGYCFLTT